MQSKPTTVQTRQHTTPLPTTPNANLPTENRRKSSEDIAEIYTRLADKADRWAWLDRLFPGPLRRRHFGDADGHVLDVACGTGPNFRYLPEATDLVGVDISEDMVAKARATLDDLNRDGEVQQMDAQALEYPDDSFDTVISALSTCTFPDPVEALREMKRVCKPEGRILLLEHGQSTVGPVARLLQWRADAHYEKVGCRLTQEPLQHVREANLQIQHTSRSFLGMITTIEATPNEAPEPTHPARNG